MKVGEVPIMMEIWAVLKRLSSRKLKRRKRRAPWEASAKLRNGTVLTGGTGLLQIAALS